MTSGNANPAEGRGWGGALSWPAGHVTKYNCFRDAIASTGLEPPEHIEPGRWVRFPGLGKSKSNRAGWCYLFPDEQAGAFGCWATCLSETWHAERRHFTQKERAAFRRQIAEAKHRAELEQAETWARAASRALDIWHEAETADPEHEYLKTKAVGPHCARQSGPRLVLPIVGWDGALSSLQFIGPDGEKRMLKGGRKRGRFIPVHGRRGANKILIGEGFATVATLAEAEPEALTLAALDAGNLEPVAVEARKRNPTAEIVIAADADAVGISKARAAAIACAGQVAVPVFPMGSEGSDWNDLAALNRKGGAQ